MNTKLSYSRTVPLLLIFVLLFTGCSVFGVIDPGDVENTTQAVDAGAATSVKVKVAMDLGELNIAGGAAKLMEGNFKFNFTDLQPDIQYVEDGKVGSLVIDQPNKQAVTSYRDAQIKWALNLNNNLPIDLEVSTGAAVAVIDLKGIDLMGLKLDIGVGSGNVDLSSGWSHDVTANLKGGISEIAVTLPQAMGTRVVIQKGLGKISASGLNRDGNVYVNDAYGKTAQTLNLNIEPGIGEVILKVK